MDEVITRAKDSINKVLEAPPCWLLELSDNEKTPLADVPNLISRLIEHDSSKNKWIRLFRRQLKRLIINNDSLPKGFWIELHDDILYVLDEANDEQSNAKTTLVRWNTLVFAEAASRGEEKPTSNKTLIDYIGEHTWFSERYCDDEDKNILKELIYHGHALILLDGLDEISEIGQRCEIVDLVEKFIDDYVRTPDFIS
ncbi:unnamed protein product, partial [Rotaria sp. Silwood1]